MKKQFFLFLMLTLLVTTTFPTTVDEYLIIGERYFAQRRFHEAHAAVQEALRLNPDYAVANFHLGVIYYHLNDSQIALERLSRAIELDGALAEAYSWRGRIFKARGKYDNALENYNMAVYLEPENDRLRRNRALFLYTALGDFTQALTDYNRAIEIDPLNYENFQQRGVCYAHQGLFEQALDDLNTAISLNDGVVENFTFRGTMLFYMGRHEEAMEDFDTAVRLDSNGIRGFFQRGHANIRLGRHHEAVSDFTEVIRIEPNNRHAFINRSVAYRYLALLSLYSDLERALYYVQRAQEDEAAANWLDSQR